MKELEIKQLCDRVRQIAYDIHVFLGPGHLERVYETALIHRLRKANISVKPQHSLTCTMKMELYLANTTRICWLSQF